jgi:hypothetical protein
VKRAVKLAVAAAACLVLSAVSASPAAAGSAPLAGEQIVLGGVVYGAPYGEGWGKARPHLLSNGGASASGVIRRIRWSSWGGAEARGRGRYALYKPRGGYYRHAVVIQLRAKQVGECEGRTAYLRLLVRTPRRPGGPLGPWRSWAGPQTICEPYGSYSTES